MAVAVAPCWSIGPARNGGQPRLRRAELLTLFSGSVLRGADLDTGCWNGFGETYSQRAVSLAADERRRRQDRRVRGDDPCP